jgi:hypothetical protein
MTALVATLLANFRTIRLPAETLPVRPDPENKHRLATAKANLAERRAVYDRRDAVRRVLYRRRYPFLDRLEADPEGGWRHHVFVADEDAVILLEGIDNCGPGDPVEFDPEEFVIERLQETEAFCES